MTVQMWQNLDESLVIIVEIQDMFATMDWRELVVHMLE